MDHRIEDILKLKGRVRLTVRNEDGTVAEIQEVDNIVVTVGRALLAQALTTPSIDVRVNKIALGTGTNTPVAGNTQLQTETYRNNIASAVNSSNIAYLTGFFSASETSGTFREAGLFIGGTASANSGTLLSRVAINITKSLAQTLTIEWSITLT